jgi:hypothetical protein
LLLRGRFRRLPLAHSPVFILAETVSGLAYRFMFEGRWPAKAIGARPSRLSANRDQRQ